MFVFVYDINKLVEIINKNTFQMIKPKKLKTGGSVLLEKHGPKYFSNLRKKGWETARKANELYKKQEAKKLKEA